MLLLPFLESSNSQTTSVPDITDSNKNNVQTEEHKSHRPKKPIQRPTNKVGKTVPEPLYRSTTETPSVNDPLWKDSYVIDGETGFTCEHLAREFHSDAAGFVNLVENEYNAIADTDKNYAKTVPASAHVYYNAGRR